MLLRLLRYKLNLEYVPGTNVCIADMLSRAHPSPETSGEDYPDEEMELRIHSLVSELPISGEKANLLKQATATDKALQSVQVLICKGWPRVQERHTYQDKAILAYPGRASRHRRSSIQGREARYSHWYASRNVD